MSSEELEESCKKSLLTSENVIAGRNVKMRSDVVEVKMHDRRDSIGLERD